MNELFISQASWLAKNPKKDEWLKAYILWLQGLRSARTRETYHRVWVDFDSFMNYMHPGAIEQSHILAWKIFLSGYASPATVNLYLSAVSSFYKFIIEHYAALRDDNPAQGIKHLAVNPYGKATWLVDGQDKALLKSIDRTTAVGARDYAILILFLTTAIRLDAIASATVDHVRMQGDVVFFHYTNKGGDDKIKRLPTRAAAALKSYLAVRDVSGDSLFGLTRRAIQWMVKRRGNEVIGKDHGITPHSLRHTAAMNAHRNGGTVREVQELLEHKSSRVTLTYLDHIDSGSGDRMSNDLDERYGD